MACNYPDSRILVGLYTLVKDTGIKTKADDLISFAFWGSLEHMTFLNNVTRVMNLNLDLRWENLLHLPSTGRDTSLIVDINNAKQE